MASAGGGLPLRSGETQDLIASLQCSRLAHRRLASCLLYLNEEGDGVFAGGATHFLELDISVAPECGAALVWFNCMLPCAPPGPSSALRERMVPDSRTAHAGMTVTSGVKYAANKWVHAQRYRPD